MGKHRIKPNYHRRVLRLPDLDHCKVAVLNSLFASLAPRLRIRHRSVHRMVLLRAPSGLQSHRRCALPHVPGIPRSGCQYHQPAACRRAPPRPRSRRFRPAQSRTGCRDQPRQRGQATRVPLRQLAECRARLAGPRSCPWSQHAGQARLRHAGDAIWLWLPPVGTGRLGTGRDPDASGALGGGGPDWQRGAYPHRADSSLGQGRVGSVDSIRWGHGGADLPSRR